MSSRVAALTLVVSLWGALAGELQAAPITFNTALPVATGEFVFRLQFKAGETEEENSLQERQLKFKAAVGVLGYGITPDLTVFAVLPFVSKKLESVNPTRKADGLSDISLFLRYTVYKDNRRGKTFRVAPFAGLKLATGNDSEKDSLGQVPAGLQPGSGSTDFFGGVVLTYQTLAWEFDAQIRVDAFNRANDVEKGDKFSFASSLQYRVWPKKLNAPVPGFLYLVIESDFSHQRKDRISGESNNSSGGNRWLISPGIQYVTRRWVAELSVQIPANERLNGAALETRFGINGGFRWNF
ncbi:MAG: transporter [Proteobacteria bacterium]|nr:transporter [Pseudomonadota bacterium]